MPYLSRVQIEEIADPILCRYRAECLPQKRLCYRVDPTELAEMLGFSVDYQRLTQNGSVLGMTASVPMWTSIYDDASCKMFYELDGHTLLIEKRLLLPNLTGRRHFTIAHELAHQIINRRFSEETGANERLCCDYRRSSPHRKVSNWHEWQADALASSLLLPQDAVLDAMFMHGLGDHVKVLSRKYSEYKYQRFCEMAEFLQVSKTALAFRMEQLGLLERNLLIQEATQRKGAA